MKNIFLLIAFAFLTAGANAQSVIKDNFSGWANVQTSNGTNSITITAFQGSPKAFDQTWESSDIAVGDIVFANCSRFVITAKSGLVLTLSDPDNANGSVFPSNGQRIGLTRETLVGGQMVGSVPQFGDGNAGAIAGTDNILAACIQAHYAKINQIAAQSNVIFADTLPKAGKKNIMTQNASDSLYLQGVEKYMSLTTTPQGQRVAGLGNISNADPITTSDLPTQRKVLFQNNVGGIEQATQEVFLSPAIEVTTQTTLPNAFVSKIVNVVNATDTMQLNWNGLNYQVDIVRGSTQPVNTSIVKFDNSVWKDYSLSVNSNDPVMRIFQNKEWVIADGKTFSVVHFGADNTGVVNSTAAFTKARLASGGSYLITKGTYLLDSLPDVWADTWKTEGQVFLKINNPVTGLTTYDASNSISSSWVNNFNTQRYMHWNNARTQQPIAIWSDGEKSGDSHRFFLPFDIRRNSHSFISAPLDPDGTSDFIWRRSATHPLDPYGTRNMIEYNGQQDYFGIYYATENQNPPQFDAAFIIKNGTTPYFKFPALRLWMNHGWNVQLRSGTGLNIGYVPVDANTQVLKNMTTDKVLQTITSDEIKTLGTTFTDLTNIPSGIGGTYEFAKIYSDLNTNNLPFTKALWSNVAANQNLVYGTLRVTATTAGGSKWYKDVDFVLDNGNLSLTNTANTFPTADVICNLVLVGNELQLQGSYNGAYGGGMSMSVYTKYTASGR